MTTEFTEMEFEWDLNKAELNVKKHGISFAHASTIFCDLSSLTFYDPDHSEEEDRFITIGTSSEDVLLIVSHTDRDDRIRIISARKTKRREWRIYQNG